jgi:solute:Na+ symporter, SSS family
VPEYLRLGFNEATRAFNAATFAIATVLIGGVNLFALALIIHLLLGWSIATAILAAAAIVMVCVTLGDLTSAIYNEVLQFFVTVAALLPLTVVALHAVGGISGLEVATEVVRRTGPSRLKIENSVWL